MKILIIALVVSSTLLTSCSAETNKLEVAQTSEGKFVGAMYPPTDRSLIYYSEFELFIPESAAFESYGDQDNTKISWLTISSEDRQTFIDLNGIKTGKTDSVGRLTYSAPIKNKRFPNEQWVINYIVSLDSDENTYMRIEIKLISEPNRNTQCKEYLADAKEWVKSGTKIKSVD